MGCFKPFNANVFNIICLAICYRPGSVEAETELIFTEGSSLPDTSTVTNAMVEAASDPNFSLSVDTSSVSARGMIFLGSFVSYCQHFALLEVSHTMAQLKTPFSFLKGCAFTMIFFLFSRNSTCNYHSVSGNNYNHSNNNR